jgi:TonB family protein
MSTEGMPIPPPLPPPPAVPGATNDPVIQMEAVIAADGRVVDAHVIRSSGHLDKDKQSVKDIQRQKFEPAKLDGQPIQGV